MNKKHKKRGKEKRTSFSGKRSKSKEKKTPQPSRKSSLTDNENTAGDVNSLLLVCKNISTLAKPQKSEKASMSMWAEPSRCCVCCIDRSTVRICECNGVSNNLPPCVENNSDKNRSNDHDKTICLGILTKERDYYKAEFERLAKLFETFRDSSDNLERDRVQCKSCDKKDQMIEYLQKENQILAKEKYFLMSRLEESGNRLDMQSPGGACQKLPCKRTERERDMLKFDVQRLEEENDCLREKFKATNENKTRDYVKFQEQRIEYENIISKLDGERRELIKAQGTRRITINALEEKVQTYSDLLRVEQNETQRMRDQYYQLKKLHDQCDKALLDTQAQLMEVEAELSNCQKKIPASNKKHESYSYRGVDESVEIIPHPKKARQLKQGNYNYQQGDEIIEIIPDPKKVRELRQSGDDYQEGEEIIEIIPEPMKVRHLPMSLRVSEEMANKETISRLEEENIKLQDELSEIKKELAACKEKNYSNEIVLAERVNEIKKLQDENMSKLTELKELQSKFDQKESASKILNAELEHLNKETNALVNSNHQQQGDIEQYKVQISVAMETINELEANVKELETTIERYEKQTQLMKLDITRYESLAAARDRELDELLTYKNSLEKAKGDKDVEAEECRRRICSLQCQCQKLKMDLMATSSKDNLIADLNSKLMEMRAERDALDKANAELLKKATKLENKLFQIICTICDNSQDKCKMLKCFFNMEETFSAGCGALANFTADGKDVATQVCICDGRCKNSKKPTNLNNLDAFSDNKASYNVDNDIYPSNEDNPRTSSLIAGAQDNDRKQFLYNFDNNTSTDDLTFSSFPKVQESYMNPAPYVPSEIVKEFVMDDALMLYKYANTQKEN